MVRNRLDKENADKKLLQNTTTNIKETSLKIWRLLLSLILFVLGIVIGLISSSHVDINRYMITSTPSSQDPSFYTTYVGVFNRADIKNDVSNRTESIKHNSSSSSVGCGFVSRSRESCKNEGCLDFDKFLNPKELIHMMSDDELFWRASMVPTIKGYPFNRVPKVAFMFLTRGPLPFLPIWERFFGGYDGLFSIYVHTQPGVILNVSPDSVFFARQIPSQKVYWGDVTMADAEKRLLANALLDFSNERFVLVSESCIPIYNFKTVHKYLTESVHSFVESYDDPTRYGRGRYSRRMMPDIRLYQWRKGSQWFEMSRALAVEIISDYKYYDLFRKYCHPSCYPDEHYIPTYLNIFHAPVNSNRTVTYVDWSLGGPHPASFGRENITESFIQKIRNNGTECWYNSQRTTLCYLFARKFNPTALEPLLDISSKVMGF
ncbi:hypothetical protein RND81_11G075500 [Saponaria officinalis]|uniref:Glycosyl transferase, family 14 n=1 Tax=Saponaria officinalis TaxID=3572 RepID=A0AAW1HJ65_SAPOF